MTDGGRAEMAARTRASLMCYLVLTFALSSVFYAWSFNGAPLDRVVPGLMWMPAVAAIVTQMCFYRTLDGLGWLPGPWQYLGLAVLMPIGYCLAVYLPVWVFGLGGFDGTYLWKALPVLPLAMVQGLVFALGEEIGWRGFLVPTLYRAGGFEWAGIGMGLIWALWHVPLIVVGGYDAGTPAWYGIPCFVTWVAAMSVVLAWLRLRSGSLWPAVLFHAVHNLAIQGIFDGSTIDTGLTKWITTEFGAGMVVVGIVLGAYFWRRRPRHVDGVSEAVRLRR
jgi:membrane protease YdiL (CAAX protease family)